MSTVIVPDALSHAINAKLDEALAKMPDAATEREALYHQLLSFFNDYGFLPEFTIVKEPEVTEEPND